MTLIEMVVAMVIFAIASTALISVLTSAATADGLARERTIALELAQQEIEYIHQLAYDDVGLQGGNPPGVVAATQTKEVAGLWYTLKVRIRWVNDPAQTAFPTGADYKQVRVTVTRNTDNTQLTRTYLYLSATGPSCGQACASIIVTTLDYALSTPLQNAQVSLYDSSEDALDVTDETGMVDFASMTPSATSGSQAYYDISASAGSSYQTLREETGPAAPGTSGAGPATAAHTQLNPSQTVSTTIHLYEPVKFNIQVNNSNGLPYTGTADIYIGENLPSLRSAQHFCWGTATGCTTNSTNGLFVATTLTDGFGSESILPGVPYTVEVVTPQGCTTNCTFAPVVAAQLSSSDGYPNTLSKLITVTLPATANVATPVACTITVTNSSGTHLSGARVDVDNNATGTGIIAPNIFLAGGVTGGGGTYTVYLPRQNGYSIMAHASSGAWALWLNPLIGGSTTSFNVPTTGSCTGTTVKVS
jgi:prepilin-type N-terminal cleavage/methylation domain-containing protein